MCMLMSSSISGGWHGVAAAGRRPTHYRPVTVSIPTGELTSATLRLRLLRDVSHHQRARSRCFSEGVSTSCAALRCLAKCFSKIRVSFSDPSARAPEISGAPSGYRGNAAYISYLVPQLNNAAFSLLGF